MGTRQLVRACTCFNMQLFFPITLGTEPGIKARDLAIIHRFVAAEAGVQYPGSPYGTCGGQSIT
jgi:hypothetical protein